MADYARLLGMVGLILVGAIVLWFRYNAPPGNLSAPFTIDLVKYYYPMLEYAVERMACGDMPLWNPYQSCGTPFLATAQVAVFYPGTWLALVLPVGTALKVQMFGQVFLGGVFAAFYHRSLGLSAYASAIGGVLFVFACSLGQVFWPPQVSTLLWLPFLFMCVERFVKGGRLGWWSGFVVGTALQILAGFPQFLFYTFYLLAPYALLRLIGIWRSEDDGLARALRRGSALAAGCVLAVGLASIQVLPTMELAGESIRQEKLDPEAIHYLDRILKLPGIGGMLLNTLDPEPRLISFDFSADAGYLGTAALMMILAAVFSRRRDPVLWFFVLAAIATFLLSFGHHGWSSGLYRIYESLPIGSTFRTPSRLRLLTLFSLITIAALGFDNFGTRLSDGVTRGWESLPFLLGAAVVVGLMLFFSSRLGLAIALVVVGMLLATWLLRGNRKLMILGQSLLLAVMMFDIFHATGAHGPMRGIPISRAQAVYFRDHSENCLGVSQFDKALELVGHDRINAYGEFAPKAIKPLGRAYKITDYEPLSPKRWRDLNEAVGGSLGYTMWGINPQRYPAIYDLTSVKLQLMVIRVRNGSNGKQGSTDRGAERYRIAALRNRGALARAYLVGAYEVCSSDTVLKHVARGDFDYRATVLLEEDPGMNRPATTPPCIPAEIISCLPERVVLATDSPDERLLVLTDTWFPGWRAFVDGIEAEIYRANYLFRAVRVPAGKHTIVFEYSPTSFRIGQTVSGLSFMVLVAICVVVQYPSFLRRISGLVKRRR